MGCQLGVGLEDEDDDDEEVRCTAALPLGRLTEGGRGEGGANAEAD